MISLESVSKEYRRGAAAVTALDDVGLEILRGEYVAVCGHSGSGKSTLLALMGGLTTPSSGRVTVDGHVVSELNPAERAAYRAATVGFVFQMFHLLPYLSVRENVLLGAERTSPQSAERADELLERFQLVGRTGHRPGELSAGERQRAAMARALLHRPALLLADEPTGNLDPANAGVLLDLVDEFHKDGGTVVLVTHNRESAERAGRTVTLERGRIVSGLDG